MPINVKKLSTVFTPENAENIKFNKNDTENVVWDVKSKSGDYVWCKPFFVTRTKTEGVAYIYGNRTSTKEPTCIPPTTPGGWDGSDEAWNNFNFWTYQDIDPNHRGVKMYHHDTYDLSIYLSQGYKLKGYDEYLENADALNYVYRIPDQEVYGSDVHLEYQAELRPLKLHLYTTHPEEYVPGTPNVWPTDRLGSWSKDTLTFYRDGGLKVTEVIGLIPDPAEEEHGVLIGPWVTKSITIESYKNMTVNGGKPIFSELVDSVTYTGPEILDDDRYRYQISGNLSRIITSANDSYGYSEQFVQYEWTSDDYIETSSMFIRTPGLDVNCWVSWKADRKQCTLYCNDWYIEEPEGPQSIMGAPFYTSETFTGYYGDDYDIWWDPNGDSGGNKWVPVHLTGTFDWAGTREIYGHFDLIKYYYESANVDGLSTTFDYDWTYYGYEPTVTIKTTADAADYHVAGISGAALLGDKPYTLTNLGEPFYKNVYMTNTFKEAIPTGAWFKPTFADILAQSVQDPDNVAKRTVTITPSTRLFYTTTFKAMMGDTLLDTTTRDVGAGRTITWTAHSVYPETWVKTENELRYINGVASGTMTTEADCTLTTTYDTKQIYCTFKYSGVTINSGDTENNPRDGWHPEGEIVTISTNQKDTIDTKVHVGFITDYENAYGELVSIEKTTTNWLAVDSSEVKPVVIKYKLNQAGEYSFSAQATTYKVTGNANEHSTFQETVGRPQYYNAGTNVNISYKADDGYVFANNNLQNYGFACGAPFGSSSAQMQLTYFSIDTETGIATYPDLPTSTGYYVPPTVKAAQQTLSAVFENCTGEFYSDSMLFNKVTQAPTDSEVWIRIIPDEHFTYKDAYHDGFEIEGPIKVPAGGELGTYKGTVIVYTAIAVIPNSSWTSYGATRPTSSTNTPAVKTNYAQRSITRLYYASNPAEHYGQTISGTWYYHDGTSLYSNSIKLDNENVIWDDRAKTATYTGGAWNLISYAISGGTSTNGKVTWTTPKTYEQTSDWTITANTGYTRPATYTGSKTVDNTNFTFNDANATAVYKGAAFEACTVSQFSFFNMNTDKFAMKKYAASSTAGQIAYDYNTDVNITLNCSDIWSNPGYVFKMTQDLPSSLNVEHTYQKVDGLEGEYLYEIHITGKMPAKDIYFFEADSNTYTKAVAVHNFDFDYSYFYVRSARFVFNAADWAPVTISDNYDDSENILFTNGIKIDYVKMFAQISPTSVSWADYDAYAFDDRLIYEYKCSSPKVTITTHEVNYDDVLIMVSPSTMIESVDLSSTEYITTNFGSSASEIDTRTAILQADDWRCPVNVHYGEDDDYTITRNKIVIGYYSNSDYPDYFTINSMTDAYTVEPTEQLEMDDGNAPIYNVTFTETARTITFNKDATNNYGTWTYSSLKIPFNATWTTSGNTVTFSDGSRNTFTPYEQNQQYTYNFVSISPSSGTVNDNKVITGSARRDTRYYRVINQASNITVVPFRYNAASPIDWWGNQGHWWEDANGVQYPYGAQFSLKVYRPQSVLTWVVWDANYGVSTYQNPGSRTVDNNDSLPSSKVLIGVVKGDIIIKSTTCYDWAPFTVENKGSGAITAICGTSGRGSTINFLNVNTTATTEKLITLPFKISDMGIYADAISENVTSSTATGGVRGLWRGPDIVYGAGGDDSVIVSYTYKNGKGDVIDNPSIMPNANCWVGTKRFNTFLSANYTQGYTRASIYTSGTGWNNKDGISITASSVDSAAIPIKLINRTYNSDLQWIVKRGSKSTYFGDGYGERTIVVPYGERDNISISGCMGINSSDNITLQAKDQWDSEDALTITATGGVVYCWYGSSFNTPIYLPERGSNNQTIEPCSPFNRNWNDLKVRSSHYTNIDGWKGNDFMGPDSTMGWTKTVKTFVWGTVATAYLYPGASSNLPIKFNNFAETSRLDPSTGMAYAKNLTSTSSGNRAEWWLGSYPNRDGGSSSAYIHLFRNRAYNDQSSFNNMSLKCYFYSGQGMTNYNFATYMPTLLDHRIKSHQVYRLHKDLHATYTKNW